MKVTLARSAGFCFGVSRAVDTVMEQIRTQPDHKKIYTFGPIIHNSEVVEELKEKGVVPLEDEQDLDRIPGGILIIRSHGVKEAIYEKAKELSIEIVDATCPFVKKIHRIVCDSSRKGRRILIVGDRNHPEVQGITGWVNGEAIIIRDEQEAQNLNLEKNTPVTIVSQTTFNCNKFNNIVEIINKKGYDTIVTNTICNATMIRQEEAAQIARQVDVMLVIGDRHSSNTRKLYEICKTYCADTYYIQTIKDLDEQNLQSGISVGITAGASTPNNIIQEVFLTCQKKKISTR